MFLQFPITAIREIKILKKLHHENVIKLKEIVTSPGKVFKDVHLCYIIFPLLLKWHWSFSPRPWERWAREARFSYHYQLITLFTISTVVHNMLCDCAPVKIVLSISFCFLVPWCPTSVFYFWTADGNKYKGGIYMVFEYMDHDLTGLADRPGMRFTVPQIKVLL